MNRVILLLQFLPLSLFSQIPKTLEKVVFTNTPRNSVTLTINITSKDDIKLKIVQGTNNAEVPINDLRKEVVQGLIQEKISSWISAFSTSTFNQIFSLADVETIDLLVLETNVTLTSINNIPTNDLKGVFRFIDSLPFYQEDVLPANKRCEDFRKQQQPKLNYVTKSNLFDLKIRSYDRFQQKEIEKAQALKIQNDSFQIIVKTLSDSLSNVTDLLDSTLYFDSTNTLLISSIKNKVNMSQGIINTNIKHINFNEKKMLEAIDAVNFKIPKQSTLFRDTICRNEYINIQQGWIYIDSVELTIKDGFLRVVKVTFGDTLKIYDGDALTKISRDQFGFLKRQEYTLFVDMRSVSFSEFLLDDFLYLKNKKKGLITKDVPFTRKKSLFRTEKTISRKLSTNGYLLNLGDAIKYNPPRNSDLIETFVPQRSRLFFTHKDVSIEVPETDVNKIITLNLFSDIVGTNADKPNGLIQAEAKFFGSLQRDKIPGRLKYGNLFLLNYFEINFVLSKVDQNNRYVQLLKNLVPPDTFSYIHTINLMQYQNLEFGAKLNLLKYSDDIHEAHVVIGAGVLQTGVSDSLIQTTTPSTTSTQTTIIPKNYNIYSVKYSLQALYRLKAISRVGIDLSITANGLKLLNDNIRVSGTAYNSIELTKNTYSSYSFLKNMIFGFQSQIWYYATRDESQRLYARLAINKDIGTRGNSFPIIQIGYSSDINKFLQFKSQ